MPNGTNDETLPDTPLTDTVKDDPPEVDDAAEKIIEDGEPFGGNFA